MDKQNVLQAAIRKNIAKEHQNEILGQIDEARNKAHILKKKKLVQ
jgi:hypothetical protein